jgi:tight adherence protein B
VFAEQPGKHEQVLFRLRRESRNMPGQAFITLVSSLVFVCVSLVIYGITRLISDRGGGLKRLPRFSGTEVKPETKVKPGVQRDKGFFRSILTAFGKVFEGQRYASGLEMDLARADISLRGSEFMALSVILTVLATFYGWVLFRNLLLAVVLGFLGGFLPSFYVKYRHKVRLAKFDSQIADSLIIMSNSLRAGYSFLQAMDMVSREMSPPISTEFAASMKEMSLGAPIEAALMSMVDRVGSEDLELVVTAVLIQRQIGGNLAEVLDNIAETIRERVKLRQEIKTLTAQGRLSGIIIGVLPIALAIFLLGVNPEYISILFTHPIGRLMIGVALVAEIVGILIIRRIVAIEV